MQTAQDVNAAWTQELRPDHVAHACRAFGLQSDPLPELFREGESFIYAARRPSDPERSVALRITHPDHRSVKELTTELAWMAFVGRNGVRVPEVLLSHAGQTVEVVASEGLRWHASALQWVAGRGVRRGEQGWHAETIERWGWQLGRMQRLALERGADYFRFHWEDPRISVLAEEFVERLPQYAAGAQEMIERVRALPRTPETYGLCHRDLHQGNLLCTPEAVTCIDFDDLCHHYFAADLAIPLYYATVFEEGDPVAHAESFARPFFRGFRAESPLPPQAIGALPDFFSLRDYELVSVLDLWGLSRASRWYTIPAGHLAHGNPLAELPWRTWFERP